MINPYKSPEQSESNEANSVQRKWSVYHRIFASIFTTIGAGFVVFWMWRFLGHEKPLTTIEIRLWLLLVFGVLLLGFCSTKLRRRYLNVASVSRYAYGLSGTVILAGMSSVFLEIFMAWYSGLEYEFFEMDRRAYGDYVWVYWLNAFVVPVIPIAICLHGVSRRRWIVVPALVFMCLVVVANLRYSFFLNHSNQIPSSWSLFFWGS